MGYETIVYERIEERIARITLNRPEKLNAMSPALLAELRRGARRLRARCRRQRPGDPRRRPIVLRGLRPHRRRLRRPLHDHRGPLGDAAAGRALAAAMEPAEADDRAGARPLPRRRDRARGPLRHRFRRRGRAIRPSRRKDPRRDPDALDVAVPDRHAAHQGVSVHRRFDDARRRPSSTGSSTAFTLVIGSRRRCSPTRAASPRCRSTC